jgi:hypothetical protein
MAQTSEYFVTQTLSRDQVTKMMNAQSNILYKGVRQEDESALENSLGVASLILGLAFIASTPASVASSVMSVLSILASNEVPTLDDMLEDGIIGLADVDAWWSDNPSFDLIKLKSTYFEYTTEGIRFIKTSGRDWITEARDGSGWHIAVYS